jgi:GNAT superfamily N-acetyltransferase
MRTEPAPSLPSLAPKPPPDARLAAAAFVIGTDDIELSSRMGNLESMSMLYLVEPLSAGKHRRQEFSCEERELTEFLHHRALPEMEARASACFVLVPKDDPGRVAGFYTLSAATISLARLPAELIRQLPKFPNLPATLLGRLARDQELRGAGLGELLVVSALRRALGSTSSVGSVAVVTDPKNAEVEGFYRKHGFRNLGGGRRMFLTMRDIAASLEKGGLA